MPPAPRALVARVALAGAAMAACVMLPACGGEGGTSGREVADADRPEAALRVSAAASLADAFADLARAFEAVHPGVRVALNLAGSATLRTQILEGAPVDVFASAAPEQMDELVAAGLVEGTPAVFATNRLVLAVPVGNPAGIRGLPDLSRPEPLVGVCAESVPCGALARRLLAAAGVRASFDTEEPDVRALRTRLDLREIDAALLYATDVIGRSETLVPIDVPEAESIRTDYPVAVLADAAHPRAARAFVTFLLSDEGREVLRRHGFGLP